MNPLYKISNLNFSYNSEGVSFSALKNIDIEIQSGEMVTFAGPSGSGKSTLLNLLGLMEDSPKDAIKFEGNDFHFMTEEDKNKVRRFDVGFIFQHFHLFPVLTVYENVEYFLIRQGLGEGERRNRVQASLELLGIESLSNKKISQLSGGQRQRVAIARALAKKPKVIIADEPTASLDQKNGEIVIDYLLKINKELGTTILISSHDPMVLAHSKKIVNLKDGELCS